MALSGLILFHGAGGDRDHPLFLALEQQLDVPIGRVNFPYRKKGPGRRPPDRMPKLIKAVNEAVGEAVEEWDLVPTDLAIGGRSMGGRAASMAIAEGLQVGGLVLLSYPLHPPGKPENLRVEHLSELDLPVLLVQGDRDPFGKPDEFIPHLNTIPGTVTEVWLTGPRSGHDPKNREGEIVPAVQDWMANPER
ncbi:MAG: dienelactone hydrolase [Acidimicrobiales bacterium]|nr:dienelactone hydrolase [Acidimicrobiales bacterium]